MKFNLRSSLLAILVAAALPAAAESPVRFNRDIRPILSANCFLCHGPDSGTRMAGLRLDRRDAALARGAFVPGRSSASKLVARILSSTSPMPPLSSHRRLTAAQKSLLVRWIAEGAPYEKHWSLVPLPASVAVPSVKNAAWCRSPIDRFVLSRLEQAGLRPSPEAGRPTWLRRVTLDLTGLPPTAAEIAAFASDTRRDAYERVADRLLASPRFGERMAQPWLDAARYADSYGYQSDQLCPTWPYRDWVVRAFNSGLSYDRFLKWQLAGDLLPNPTSDQRLATAFNRLHRMTNEGGSVPEEWRVEGVADRVQTLGTAIMGFTLQCARCHDHKFDPITQRDYYALHSFLNNIEEYGLYDAADRVPTPSLLLPTPREAKALEAAKADLRAKEQACAALPADRSAAFEAWFAKPDANPSSGLVGRFDFGQADGTAVRNLVSGGAAAARAAELKVVDGPRGKAVLFDGDNGVSFGSLGGFTRSTPFTVAFSMRDPGRREGAAVVFQACDGTDAGPYGYDLLTENGRLTARIFRFWPGNAIAVRTRAALAPGVWRDVAVTYDGSSRAAGLHIFVDGLPLPLEVIEDRLYKDTGSHTLIFGQRFRDRGFKDGQVADVRIFNREIAPIEALQLSDSHSLTDALQRPAAHRDDLRALFLSAVDAESASRRGALTTARQAIAAAENRILEVSVMEERSSVRPTYRLSRGRYDAPVGPADRVGRTLPEGIYPFPPALPRNRLGLAEWLTLPGHPLTARVAVNRFWAMLFGRGIVETVEDFGVQGKPPTHPELLDWLARDFVRSGWNTKRLLRQMVLSAVYRQTSALRPDLLRRDPANALYARGPAHRLTAEEIRDAALYASGLLDERIGGPPVSPYQPGDLWRETNTMSPAYHQSVGPDLYRRSLYTVWKRTAPMPDVLAFDAPTREVCTGMRSVTNTPLQALVLLDGPQYVEAARVLGGLMWKQGGASDSSRVRFAFLRLAGREPSTEELRLLTELFKRQRALFTGGGQDPVKLIHIGDSAPDPAVPPVELAAATIVAQTILNMDATVWER